MVHPLAIFSNREHYEIAQEKRKPNIIEISRQCANKSPRDALNVVLKSWADVLKGTPAEKCRMNPNIASKRKQGFEFKWLKDAPWFTLLAGIYV